MLSLNLQFIKSISSENGMVKIGKQEVRPWGGSVCDFTGLICVNDLAKHVQIPSIGRFRLVCIPALIKTKPKSVTE